MTLVAITFVLSLSLTLGTYWLFIVRPEEQSKASAVGRLKKYKSAEPSIGVVKAPERLSHIPLLERLLSHRTGATGRIQALLVESGLQWTVGTFLLACFVGAAAGAVIGWRVLHFLAAAVVLGAAGAVAPYFFVRFKRSKRLARFEEQFPEAMDLISRALRAGHAFTTGLGMVADEIPAPVGPEFRRLYDEQNFGMSLAEAMRAMAARVPVLDAKFFVTAVLTQREAGGNLSEVLDNLASVMRDRFKLKRQIRVISAHGRISAWVLSCLPPGLAVILFTLSPQFMSTLVTDPWGIRLVLVAGILQVIGTIIIARLVRLDY
jgi:tight adherence protein B